MKHALARLATSAPLLLALSAPASAAVIDFTGGTATLLDATTQTTNNSVSWQGVDYYEENGFRLDFIPNTGSTGFSTNLGDYYGAGNDVIHAHWATGNFGGVEAIEITKIGGGTFDLNYFILTSNTDVGGSAASGLERAFVEGFLSGVSTGAPVTMKLALNTKTLPLLLGLFFGLSAQAPFFVIKQGTLLVKGDSTAVQAVCGQPALFKGKQVQCGNTAKYQ